MNLLKSGGIIDEPINENLHFLKHPNIQDFPLINFNILGNIYYHGFHIFSVLHVFQNISRVDVGLGRAACYCSLI